MRTIKGHLYQRSPRGSWYVRIVYQGKVIVKSTGTKSRREAEKIRAVIVAPYQAQSEAAVLKAVAHRIADTEEQAEKLKSTATPPPAIAKTWERFLASPLRPDSGGSTLNQYAAEWRRFTEWLSRCHPGVNHLHEVTPLMAADYANDLTAAKVSPSTFNQHINFLCMLWRVMGKDAKLADNIWDKDHISRKKLNALASRKRALNPTQFEALLATVGSDTDMHDLFTLLAWTGQRLADIVLLKWAGVDFNARIISLAPMKTARRQGKMVHIPMFPATIDVLNRRQSGRTLDPCRYVFEDFAANYNRAPSQLSKRITAAFKAAGIDTSEERADRGRQTVVYGAHSFRHLFVTAASAVGMPSAMIKSITGHATDEMMQHYQHLGVEHVSEMAMRIGSNNSPTNTLPLPPAPAPERTATVLQNIRQIAEGMTPETWEQNRQRILDILPSP